MGRRTGILLVLLSAMLACAVAPAGATPTISLSAHAKPVKAFAHTGDIAGAGASLEIGLTIAGTEYGGFPAPLRTFTLRLPHGMKWNAHGFPTCDYTQGEVRPVESPLFPICPSRARIGTTSSADADVAFGREVLPETLTLEEFYSTRGSPLLIIEGHDPVLFELVAPSRIAAERGSLGLRLSFEFPLVETVPGGNDSSTTRLDLTLGSGLKAAHKRLFSLHMPKTCPRGGLKFAVEASFGVTAEQTSSASYRAPCPKPAKKRARHT